MTMREIINEQKIRKCLVSFDLMAYQPSWVI